MTVELLRLNAVVGVKGTVNEAGELTKVGVTCALCHSSVDNSFAPGIGKRLDGWANTDLNVGEAAERGKSLFRNEVRCATCHQSPRFTDVLSGPVRTLPFLHHPTEVGMDPGYAARSATRMYRTTPLRGLQQHPPYFHDGSAPDLPAAVNHYDKLFGLNLTAAQKADLVEYLKSR